MFTRHVGTARQAALFDTRNALSCYSISVIVKLRLARWMLRQMEQRQSFCRLNAHDISSVRLDWWRFGGFENLSITLCDRTNSPTISRFTRCTVPLPTPTNRRHLEDAMPGAQMPPDGVLDLRRHLGRPSFFPCWRTRSRPARTLLRMICRSCSPKTDAIWIMAPSHRRGAVDGLLVGIEGNASSIEFGKGIRHVENAAPKPTDGVGQPGVRKKSLYTGDTSDTNLSPEIRSGSQSSTSSTNGPKWRRTPLGRARRGCRGRCQFRL